MSRTPTTLPDLDEDAAFREKLRPLAARVLPGHALPEDRITGQPDAPDSRTTERPVVREIPQEDPAVDDGSVAAALKIAAIRAARGSKRRFEYLLPERVGNALADDADKKGMSAAQRLLEILKDAGYPVIQEDFTDIRKMRRR